MFSIMQAPVARRQKNVQLYSSITDSVLQKEDKQAKNKKRANVNMN